MNAAGYRKERFVTRDYEMSRTSLLTTRKPSEALLDGVTIVEPSQFCAELARRETEWVTGSRINADRTQRPSVHWRARKTGKRRRSAVSGPERSHAPTSRRQAIS